MEPGACRGGGGGGGSPCVIHTIITLVINTFLQQEMEGTQEPGMVHLTDALCIKQRSLFRDILWLVSLWRI